MVRFALTATLVLLTLIASCGKEPEQEAASASTSDVKSYGELATDRAKTIDESGEQAIPEAENPYLAAMLAGMDDVKPATGSVPATFVLSEAADKSSLIPSRFRISAEKAKAAIAALIADPNVDSEARLDTLNGIDIDISSAIDAEMDIGETRREYWNALARLEPHRRVFCLVSSAEGQSCWDGVDGYFGNYSFEAIAAEAAYRSLGLKAPADALKKAIDSMPRDGNGAIRWWAYPLPTDAAEACEAAFDLVCEGRYDERLRFALQFPELFFTNAPDHHEWKPTSRHNP